MHAGLLLFVVVVVVVVVVVCCRRRPTGGSGLTSGRGLGSTVRLLRSNCETSMGLNDQAMQ